MNMWTGRFTQRLARAVVTTAAAGAFALGSAAASNAANVIRIGFPNETEPAILGYMTSIILEKKLGLKTEISPNLGGTAVARQALIDGALDIYPDYTGDALANQLKEDPIGDPDASFERVASQFKELYHITWLEPTKFNNTYALAIKRERADEFGLDTISDLAPHAPEWSLGSSVEFAGRPSDGYAGMTKAYGFEFGKIVPMDVGLMYTAVDSGQVDMIVAFATDARIGLVGLKVLDDDRHFFPSYNASITIRDEVLDAHPEIRQAIDDVIGKIDTDTMVALNGQGDIDKLPLDKVAENYLRKIGVIE